MKQRLGVEVESLGVAGQQAGEPVMASAAVVLALKQRHLYQDDRGLKRRRDCVLDSEFLRSPAKVRTVRARE